MKTEVSEIADKIYRLSTFVPQVGPNGFTFNQFLIDADQPLLFHYGQRSLFPLISDAVKRVIPLDKLSEVLPQVKTPLTGIWGEFDSTTYPHIQERIDLFRALQPDFQMHIIEGAGHWVAYEAAEAFNRKLIDVLLQ